MIRLELLIDVRRNNFSGYQQRDYYKIIITVIDMVEQEYYFYLLMLNIYYLQMYDF